MNAYDTASLIGNMTASGPSLREWVEQVTGCDPITEPDFQWSNDKRCDGAGCGVIDSTVVIELDGDHQRLCYHCCAEIGVGPVS